MSVPSVLRFSKLRNWLPWHYICHLFSLPLSFGFSTCLAEFVLKNEFMFLLSSGLEYLDVNMKQGDRVSCTLLAQGLKSNSSKRRPWDSSRHTWTMICEIALSARNLKWCDHYHGDRYSFYRSPILSSILKTVVAPHQRNIPMQTGRLSG